MRPQQRSGLTPEFSRMRRCSTAAAARKYGAPHVGCNDPLGGPLPRPTRYPWIVEDSPYITRSANAVTDHTRSRERNVLVCLLHVSTRQPVLRSAWEQSLSFHTIRER
jgi:hypothetical protein